MDLEAGSNRPADDESELPYRRCQDLGERARTSRFLVWSVGTFIVVTSFLYGLFAGLRGDRSLAFATLGDRVWETLWDTGPGLERLQLPRGVIASPMGNDVRINDRAGEVASFVTKRAPQEIVNEMKLLWEQRGARVLAFATERRGFALAVNFSTHERQLLSVWSVPPTVRQELSSGYPVQGIVSLIDFAEHTAVPGDGEVPEVPLPEGGKGGAVFSALDAGGRSWSGVYTVPGKVEEVLDFYTDELRSRGWRLMDRQDPAGESLRMSVGSLRAARGSEEIVLLVSPRTADDAVVSVNRGPKIDLG